MKYRIWVVCSLLLLILAVPAWPVRADDGAGDVLFRASYILKGGERRASDLTMVAGTVELQPGSLVEGNVVIVGGEAAIDGEVRGSIIAWGGQVSLGPNAVVHGDAVVLGAFRRHENAQIWGTVIDGVRSEEIANSLAGILPGRSELGAAEAPVPSRDMGYAVGSLTTLLMILGGAALVNTLLPAPVGHVSQAMRGHALLSLGVGALTIILLLVLLPILIILCLGIPFAIVLAIALALCGVLGWVAAGRIAGHRIVRAVHSSRFSTLGETLVGTLVITLLSMVPCAGFLLALGIVSWGVGGAVLTRLGTADYPPDSTWAPQPSVQVQRLEQSATSTPRSANPERSAGPWGRDTRPLNEAEIWGP